MQTRTRQFTTFALVIVYSILSLISPSLLLAEDRIKLPDLGDSSGTVVTPELEKKLGEAFIRNIRRHVPLVEDPLINEYIQQIGDRIAANSEAPNQAFHFFVVDENAINAFAGPGGYVGVNSGLIVATENESELASVLAHEVGHITQRHLQRAIESASQMAVPSAAAMLAALALGLALPGVGPAAVIAVQAGQVQQQINFTRSHEAEADRAGLLNLAKAGFDPRSMPDFFGRLQTAGRYYGQNIPEILLTHPAPASRIADTSARAEEYPYKQVNSSLDYLNARVALRVQSQPVVSPDLHATLIAESNQGTAEQKAAGRYGLGLALQSLKRHTEAAALYQELHREYPDVAWYSLAYAKSLMESGQKQLALQELQQAEQQFPERRSINLYFAESLLTNGQPQAAYDRLQVDLRRHGPSLTTYDLLAVASGRLDRQAEGYGYRAEYLYLLGQTKDAITQLKQAQRTVEKNSNLASAIDARMKQMEDELKAQET